MNLILMVWAWDECTKSIYHVSMLHVYIGLFRPFDTLSCGCMIMKKKHSTHREGEKNTSTIKPYKTSNLGLFKKCGKGNFIVQQHLNKG